MTTFLSPQLHMLNDDDVYSNYYPSSCSSVTSPMYTSMHQMPQKTLNGTFGGMPFYPEPQSVVSDVVSTFPPEQQMWTTASPQSHHLTPSYTPSYSYPPVSSSLAPTQPFPDFNASPLTPQLTPQLSPNPSMYSRASRSPSSASVVQYARKDSSDSDMSRMSRSISPSAQDLRAYGTLNKNGTWSCAYPGCSSRAVFTRGCDLRKHHKRHTKSFFCTHEGCPQSMGGGFSSKKDLARHEAKHNPAVVCEWKGCDRIFSRVDNMVS